MNIFSLNGSIQQKNARKRTYPQGIDHSKYYVGVLFVKAGFTNLSFVVVNFTSGEIRISKLDV